jgi:hypothetical protein
VEKTKKVLKGVKRSVVTKDITFEQYKQCLDDGKNTRVVQHTIQSKKHQITTNKIKKRALSAYDNKRWVTPGGIYTLAHGHKDAVYTKFVGKRAREEEEEDAGSTMELESQED